MVFEADAQNVEIYNDENGNEPFINWLLSLTKTDEIRIRERLRRVELGNLGDYRYLSGEIYELRFNFGPGYRIYFAKLNKKIILLLAGGDKSTQARDIKKARNYYKEYKEQVYEKIEKV